LVRRPARHKLGDLDDDASFVVRLDAAKDRGGGGRKAGSGGRDLALDGLGATARRVAGEG
jgi:hypothetical protein